MFNLNKFKAMINIKKVLAVLKYVATAIVSILGTLGVSELV